MDRILQAGISCSWLLPNEVEYTLIQSYRIKAIDILRSY
jgi:hypothetical protein